MFFCFFNFKTFPLSQFHLPNQQNVFSHHPPAMCRPKPFKTSPLPACCSCSKRKDTSLRLNCMVLVSACRSAFCWLMDSCNVRNSWQMSVKTGRFRETGGEANLGKKKSTLYGSASHSQINFFYVLLMDPNASAHQKVIRFGKDDMLQIQSKSPGFILKKMYQTIKTTPDFFTPSNRPPFWSLSSHLPRASRARCLHRTSNSKKITVAHQSLRTTWVVSSSRYFSRNIKCCSSNVEMPGLKLSSMSCFFRESFKDHNEEWNQ